MDGPRRGLLIFDLDGTLFRTDICSVRALESVFRDRTLGAPPADEWVGLFGRPDQDFIAWLDAHAGPGLGGSLLAEIARREVAMVPGEGQLFPGAGEALAALKPRVEQMAICSNGPEPYVRTVLSSMAIGGCFDGVRWRRADDLSKSEMIADLLACLPARPAIVIGDRKEDVEAAHANNLAVIGAAYGYGRPGEMDGADALASSAAELPDVVLEMLSASEC